MFPVELVPDGEGGNQFSPRPISLEEAFGRQNDRIAYLRSVGQPWAEAVFELRDLIVGIEDEEFWDGIPAEVRAGLPKQPKPKQEAEREKWAPGGWAAFPCRAIPGPGGRPIYLPTSEELSHARRIVLRLAARRGLTWKTKRISSLPKPQDALENEATVDGA